MFEKLIMDASFVRIDGWWKTLSTENDFLRGLAWRQVSKHGQRVAHRNSTHAYALDNTFRFIDAILDTETEEVEEKKLMHASGEAEKFYRELEAPALIGMEATGNARWFELLVDKCGHTLWVGDAAKIRASYVRKQKTDKRDAGHILTLLVEERFPRLWLPDAQQRDIRQLLTHRHKLVGVRTRLKTGLQHLALNQGVQKKRQLWNEKGRALLESLPLQGWTQQRRKDLLQLLKVVEPQIEQLDKAVAEAAKANPQAVLLMSQPGVGPVTALAFAVTIGEVSRFKRSKQVSSYLGLIPSEQSSGNKQKIGKHFQTRQCLAAHPAGGVGAVCRTPRSGISQRVSTPLPPQGKRHRQGRSSTQISRTALLDAEVQQAVCRGCSQRGQPASSRGGQS